MQLPPKRLLLYNFLRGYFLFKGYKIILYVFYKHVLSKTEKESGLFCLFSLFLDILRLIKTLFL